jgi:hypothetical protein
MEEIKCFSLLRPIGPKTLFLTAYLHYDHHGFLLCVIIIFEPAPHVARLEDKSQEGVITVGKTLHVTLFHQIRA